MKTTKAQPTKAQPTVTGETRQQRRARYLRAGFRKQARKSAPDVVIYHAAAIQAAVETALLRAEEATGADALRFLKVAAQLEAALRPYLFSLKLLRDSVQRRNTTKEEREAALRQRHEDILAGRVKPWDETGGEDEHDE